MGDLLAGNWACLVVEAMDVYKIIHEQVGF